MNNNFEIYAKVILHSYGEEERDFEVLDINFDEKYIPTEEIYKENSKKAIYMDAIYNLAIEEVSDCGQTFKLIHKELWNKYKEDQSYKICIGLNFKDTRDFYNEVDIDVDFEYEELEIGLDIFESL